MSTFKFTINARVAAPTREEALGMLMLSLVRTEMSTTPLPVEGITIDHEEIEDQT